MYGRRKTLVCGIYFLVFSLLLACPSFAVDVVRVNGSGSGLHMMKPLIKAYALANPEAAIEMEKPLGSSGAIKALLAGAMDIAVSSRLLKPAEVSAGATLQPYGQTPLAIVANQDVGKKDVSSQELVDLYAGKIRNWPAGGQVRLVLRPVEDADTKIIRKFSPEMDAAMTSAQARPGMTVAVTDPEALEAIAKTSGALGASGLTGVMVEALPVNVMSVNGVGPTPEALATGAYPLAKTLDFVTMDTLPAPARKFLAFIYSPEGRTIAQSVGVQVTAGEQSPW